MWLGIKPLRDRRENKPLTTHQAFCRCIALIEEKLDNDLLQNVIQIDIPKSYLLVDNVISLLERYYLHVGGYEIEIDTDSEFVGHVYLTPLE